MTLTRDHVRSVLETYVRAWERQDDDLILSIFTQDAAYHERVLEEPHRGHAGIRAYWRTKVVESQSRIRCTVLNVYIDGDTAIAEWEATFDDLTRMVRKRMREVAILEFEGHLIRSLREYWASAEISDVVAPG